MKIGILTLQYPDNYGAMLQAYALQKYFYELGHNVSIINYLPIDYYQNYAIFDLSKHLYIKNRIERLIYRHMYRKQHYLFTSFRKNELNLTRKISADRIGRELSKYDLVIYGSDQVWNDSINGHDEVYYGAHVDNAKRISYAASFGKDEINQFQYNMISKYLKYNIGLSCRDLHGTEAINSVAQNNRCICVCDPVFLLDKGNWQKFSEGTSHEPYIFYYALAKNASLNNATKQLSESLGCKVKKVHPLCQDLLGSGEMERFIGPKQFVSMIANAEFVCTDSFHALCFSIIFGKKIIVIPSPEKGGRLRTLLNVLSSCQTSGYGVNMYDMKDASSFFKVEIAKSKAFLNNKIDECLEVLS